MPAAADERGYAVVRRHWNDGDVIELTLPMQLRTVPRDRGAVGLRLGPLAMVHGIEEIWRPVPDHKGLAEWEIIPRSMWNCGVWLDDPAGLDSWPVERRPVPAVPLAAETAAVVVHGNGAMLRDWQLPPSYRPSCTKQTNAKASIRRWRAGRKARCPFLLEEDRPPRRVLLPHLTWSDGHHHGRAGATRVAVARSGGEARSAIVTFPAGEAPGRWAAG